MAKALSAFAAGALVLFCCGIAGASPGERNVPPALDARAAQTAAAVELLGCLMALGHGDYTGGEKLCSKAIELNPKDGNAWRLRGYGYLLTQRFERANADFRTALDLGLKDGETWAGYGRSFSGEGRFAEAMDPLRRAVALEPRNAAYWNALCWAQAGTGKALQSALAHCNRAIALAPAMAGPWNSRGLTQLRLGRIKAAISDYTQSLKLSPHQPSAFFGRGLAWLKLGQNMPALADIATARAGDAQIDTLFVTLGVLPPNCADIQGGKGCPPGTKAAPQTGKPPPLVVAFRLRDDDDQFILSLDAGRFDVMLDQIAILLGRPEEVFEDASLPQNHAETAARLAQSIARFNRLLPLACRARPIAVARCAPLPAKPPAPGRLGKAYDTAYFQLYPIWEAMCRGHEQACQIE